METVDKNGIGIHSVPREPILEHFRVTSENVKTVLPPRRGLEFKKITDIAFRIRFCVNFGSRGVPESLQIDRGGHLKTAPILGRILELRGGLYA